jgi:hypothetical protein
VAPPKWQGHCSAIDRAHSRDPVALNDSREDYGSNIAPAVMAGLVPAIHVFLGIARQERGCPAQGRA